VRGIPWAYTWKELKDMFAEIGEVERADVVYGEDGRSRVGGGAVHPLSQVFEARSLPCGCVCSMMHDIFVILLKAHWLCMFC
jgi:hypothetical protein